MKFTRARMAVHLSVLRSVLHLFLLQSFMSAKLSYIEVPVGLRVIYWCPLCAKPESYGNLARHLDSTKHKTNLDLWSKGEIQPQPPQIQNKKRRVGGVPGHDGGAQDSAVPHAQDLLQAWLDFHRPSAPRLQQDEQHQQNDIDQMDIQTMGDCTDGGEGGNPDSCNDMGGGTRSPLRSPVDAQTSQGVGRGSPLDAGGSSCHAQAPMAVPVSEDGLYDEAFNPAFTVAPEPDLSGPEKLQASHQPLPLCEAEDALASDASEDDITAEFAQMRLQAGSEDDSDGEESVCSYTETILCQSFL